jgi:hypothetical protein
MINHTRTLLLNMRADIDPNFPGEEYVAPDFLVRTVPTVVQKFRNLVFGGEPDRYMLNYRLYQLMTVLHSTELEEYVSAQDSRITYLPLRLGQLYESMFIRRATILNQFTGDFNFIGDLVGGDEDGRLYHSWRVDVTSSSLIRVQRTTKPLDQETFEYTYTDGLSDLIPLLGSSLQFNFSAPVGAEWIVEAVSRPQLDMGQLLAALNVGMLETDELALFGTAPAEPLKTFRNLWRDHDEYAYKFSGLLLGITYLMDQQQPVG